MKKSYLLSVSWVSCGLLLGTILIASKASSLYGYNDSYAEIPKIHEFAYNFGLPGRDRSTDQLEKESPAKVETPPSFGSTSWTCSSCYISNSGASTNCVGCGTKR